MAELKITRAAADIAYVIVHDTGKFFLVDDVCTSAPGTPNTIKHAVDTTYAMQTGQHQTGSFVVDLISGATRFVGPFFSDVDMKLTAPDGTVSTGSGTGVTYTKTPNSVDINDRKRRARHLAVRDHRQPARRGGRKHPRHG